MQQEVENLCKENRENATGNRESLYFHTELTRKWNSFFSSEEEHALNNFAVRKMTKAS